MLQTSAPFGVAIRKSTRTSSSKVKFAVIDVTAASDAEVEVSNEQYFVDGQSIVTNPTSPEFQMATFEDDYFKLDGSMYLAPDNLSPSYKLGWISDVMSDENGVFLDYENMIATVANAAQNWEAWDHYTVAAYWDQLNRGQIDDKDMGKVFYGKKGTSPETYLYKYYPFTFVKDQPYVMSIYLRATKDLPSQQVIGYINANTPSGWTYITDPIYSSIQGISTEWRRYDFVQVPTVGTSEGGIGFMFPDLDPTVTLYAAQPQLITGSQPRDFVNGKARPVIDITFDDPHSSLGLGLFFGTNDVCSDFEVKWYQGDVEAESLLIENNDQQEVNISKPVDNYTRVLITFMKTISPYRYARLMRIEFGLNEVFTDDSIISGTVIEEVDPVSAALSINTLKFTVLNKDQRFNMLNPDGIYRYLQTRQQIKAQSGVMLDDGTYEYVDLGVFYLSNWQNATGLKASLEATDVIGLLDKTTYWKSKFWVNTQIADIINDIISDAGNFNVTISPDIAGISLTGYIDVKSHRNALLDVLVAARCTARVERDGSIKVFKVNYNEGVDEIANDLIIGEPSIELLPLITSVQVTEYSYGTNVPVGEVYSSDFNVSGTSTILIPFGRAVSDAIISVSEGATIVGTPKISAVAAEVVISANGPVTVKVTGQPRSESMRVVSASLSTVDAGAIPQVAELSNSNKLISGNGLAVAQHILDYSQKRIKQTIRYWNNPAVQAGDIVDIETMFQSFKSGAIEKQEIEFAPSLNAKLEVVG